ncbi:HNH endonuclease [Tenacibaculum xiamenense]|uniref:HNH endonuclease n=1 Tax=Tenacibaculum xiamenense TaxID=1261553 RepID=UPI003895BE6B
MNEIFNESEFWKFMKLNGPNSSNSKRNYISWLRYINREYQIIDRTISENKIDNVVEKLKVSVNNRSIYISPRDISNMKSAMKKYLKYSKSEQPNETLLNDILEIIEKKRTHISEIETRLGQGKYRDNLIKLWKKCSVSKLEKIDVLIASHIKPWINSNNHEKIDVYNGLLLSPNIDKLFDKGYISFKDNGSIIVSKLIEEKELNQLGVRKNDSLYCVFEENKKYLKFHRENILMK